MYERRLLRLFFAVAALLLVVGGRAFQLQVLHADELLLKKGGVLRSASPVRPIRGEILWADDSPAVRNGSRYAVRVSRAEFETGRVVCGSCGHETDEDRAKRPCPDCAAEGAWRTRPGPDAGALADCLGLDRREVADALADALERCRRYSWRTADLFPRKRIPADRAAALALRVREFPGIEVRGEPWRETDPAIAPIAGRTHVAWAEDVTRLRDPARAAAGLHVHSDAEVRNTLVGSWGLERREDERLRGVPGVVERRPTVPGEPAREPEVVVPVQDGRPIRTTLVRAVQQAAQEIADASPAEACGAVVLDLRDGAVVAAASHATKDPYFRPSTGLMPGSVFKIVPALAALAEGVSPDACLDCATRGWLRPGVRYTCTGWHPGIGLRAAFAKSCNYYFMHRVDDVGPAAMEDAYRRLGLDAEIRLGIGVAPGRPVRVHPRVWSDPQSGIGQGGTLATPLQIATAYARLATRGRKLVPYVDRDEGPAPSSREADPVIARHADFLLDAARAVVAEGTASGVPELVRLDAGGKSGTAEVEVRGRGLTNNAWFVGFAPAAAPRFVAVVVHERIDREHGAKLAGPDVARLLEAALGGR